MSEIDLHTHSTASDGSLKPSELIKKARQKNLRAIALTDHDTTAGLPEAIQAGTEWEIEVIPGCELSIDFPHGQMHILGLWLSLPATTLENHLKFLREKRHNRNREIVQKLQAQGISISYEEVLNLAGKGTVGRPHIAQVLVHNNAVKTVAEAFERFIGPKGSAYVPKTKLTPDKAISVLKGVQATVILAHPFSLELSDRQLASTLIDLKDMGLDGLEVFYSKHSKQQTADFLKLANKLNLLVSGGSDFHGQAKPDIELGQGKNKNLNLSYSIVQNIKNERIQRGLWVTNS